MSFGLKNAGATYQRAIQACLSKQIGENIEAYVDDVVVKTKDPSTLIADLQQAFDSLCKYKWKLNLTKCVFGVPSGQLLGFLVNHRGIEASTKQIQAITWMTRPPQRQRCSEANRMHGRPQSFYIETWGKGLPFFKLLLPGVDTAHTGHTPPALPKRSRQIAA
jgi:hypothetical protein